MSKTKTASFEYDRRLTTQERRVLESKEAAFSDATMQTDCLYWTFVEDVKKRRFYQLKKHADPSKCYVELTLDEIATFDDEDIKRIILFQERPCIDVDRRIERWIQRLDELQSRIRDWLRDRHEWTVTTSSVRQSVEDLMRQRGVQPRDLPVLTLTRGLREVKFVPNALFVVGANGRIDVLGRGWHRTLVDMASDDAPERDWRIVPAERPTNLQTFNQAALFDMLDRA